MTKQEFDNYRFSINTIVQYHGEMVGITEVDFEQRWVGISSGQILTYDEIKVIGEKIED